MLANFAKHQEMDGVGIDHHLHHHQNGLFSTQQQQQPQHLPTRTTRKRKPEAPPENNERLSKRMSLLNLEQTGQKLYVPVENSDVTTRPPQSAAAGKPSRRRRRGASAEDNDAADQHMQLDDTKYKVYIYNLDDELSSSDSEPEAGRLVFLPDIEKHLRTSRIPPHVPYRPGNAAEGKELVLYGVPSSISVPEEKDSVRRAIVESWARAREKQAAERGAASSTPFRGLLADVSMDAEVNGTGGLSGAPPEEDPDAMELD